MKQGFQIAVAAIILLLNSVGIAYAQVSFPQSRGFVVERACEAYTSLRNKTYPVALEIGATYVALAENRQPDPTHTLIRLGAENKWVELGCGHYADGVVSTQPVQPTSQPEQCLPFFDNENNPVKVNVGGLVDITPPAPPLNDFDLAVNGICGAPGKVVSPAEFQSLLRSHPEVLERIRAFTGNRVFANRPVPDSGETFLRDLTDAWFAIKAFDHIMCGQPEAGKAIGGLHFVGRYVQLQASGDACRMSNFRQNEVVPGVLYSMGATMKSANGGIARSSIKGYGMTLNAEDILKVATRAFAENPTPSQESTACLLPLADDGVRFTTVFVRRAAGIRTFYPDATPDPREAGCTSDIKL